MHFRKQCKSAKASYLGKRHCTFYIQYLVAYYQSWQLNVNIQALRSTVQDSKTMVAAYSIPEQGGGITLCPAPPPLPFKGDR